MSSSHLMASRMRMGRWASTRRALGVRTVVSYGLRGRRGWPLVGAGSLLIVVGRDNGRSLRCYFLYLRLRDGSRVNAVLVRARSVTTYCIVRHKQLRAAELGGAV